MDFEPIDEIWDELYEISTGQVPNGQKRLEEMYNNGLINEADYEDTKSSLNNQLF